MKRALAGLLFAAVAGLGWAAAPDWPTKPVRIIVPFPPGGSVDALARNLGARLTNVLGQQCASSTTTRVAPGR